MKSCKCGGKAITEDGFIDNLNSTGKFICCSECNRQTKVFLNHEESKAIDDWENDIVDEAVTLFPSKYNFEQFKNRPEIIYKPKMRYQIR